MYNKESYPCASYILGLSSVPFPDSKDDKGDAKVEKQQSPSHFRTKHKLPNTPVDTLSVQHARSNRRRAKIVLSAESFRDTTSKSTNQHDQQRDKSRAQEKRNRHHSTLYARGEDLAEFGHFTKVDIEKQSRHIQAEPSKAYHERCSRHQKASPSRKHNALASYDRETREYIDILSGKLSLIFFDGGSDERQEHGSSDENLHPALPLPSPTSSTIQEEQLYHKPVKERQRNTSSDMPTAYMSQCELIQDGSQEGSRQGRISQPHIARPMDFLRPVRFARNVGQEPVYDDVVVENEEVEPESVPLNVLLEAHDSYAALLNKDDENDATNTQEAENYPVSSSSSEGEQPSQLSAEFIQQASHQEIFDRITYSELSFEERYEAIGRFIERLQQELYRDMPADSQYCAEKIWAPEVINNELYTRGVLYVRQSIRDTMVKAPLMPLYKKIGNGRESSTLCHKYNPVTKPNIYSNGLPGEGVTRAYFKAHTGGYTRWKGTHLYQSTSLRRNSDGEEEIIDDNNEEDVLKRQESDVTRASLEMYPPHEQNKLFRVLRDALNTQRTASDDALAYWTNVLRPFGIDGNFSDKICSAPYEDQPEDVQKLLVDCLLWAEKIDRISLEHFHIKEPLPRKDT